MLKPKSPSSIGIRFFRQADYPGREEALIADLDRAFNYGYKVVLVDS
jgi:hypothetical protein